MSRKEGIWTGTLVDCAHQKFSAVGMAQIFRERHKGNKRGGEKIEMSSLN